ncbi:hypothetical protein DI273_21480 [Streptomyces violascens]|nr:hypothetical protein DI273_21480 [Streptomyces violascens]
MRVPVHREPGARRPGAGRTVPADHAGLLRVLHPEGVRHRPGRPSKAPPPSEPYLTGPGSSARLTLGDAARGRTASDP